MELEIICSIRRTIISLFWVDSMLGTIDRDKAKNIHACMRSGVRYSWNRSR
jgi:hypothetical protein